MKSALKIKKLIKVLSLTLALVFYLIESGVVIPRIAGAMPFYDLKPKEIVLRAEFSTNYASSTDERKSNIKLAASALNNAFIDVGGELSFNAIVGERTVTRGYKSAKIIVNGEFVEGVGGGVCQVSTTLYNAALLAGLKITEYHAHSLPVSYVARSFDAMVNSGSADLKFINNTDNPIYLKTYANGEILRIEVYGQPLELTFERKSVTIEEIPAPEYDEIYDDNGDYPELYEGERLFVKYGRAGYKSEGYLIAVKNGKTVKIRKIRSDYYKPVKGLIVHGRAVRLNDIDNEICAEDI